MLQTEAKRDHLIRISRVYIWSPLKYLSRSEGRLQTIEYGYYTCTYITNTNATDDCFYRMNFGLEAVQAATEL